MSPEFLELILPYAISFVTLVLSLAQRSMILQSKLALSELRREVEEHYVRKGDLKELHEKIDKMYKEFTRDLTVIKVDIASIRRAP